MPQQFTFLDGYGLVLKLTGKLNEEGFMLEREVLYLMGHIRAVFMTNETSKKYGVKCTLREVSDDQDDRKVTLDQLIFFRSLLKQQYFAFSDALKSFTESGKRKDAEYFTFAVEVEKCMVAFDRLFEEGIRRYQS